MSKQETIHVRIGDNPTGEEMDRIQESMKSTFPEKRIVVSTDDVELSEIPALDEYADVLAKRVAEQLEVDNE